MDQIDGCVPFGLFKGLLLGKKFGWASGDSAIKLFGLCKHE